MVVADELETIFSGVRVLNAHHEWEWRAPKEFRDIKRVQEVKFGLRKVRDEDEFVLNGVNEL